MTKTIEQRVGEAVLQKAKEVVIGDRTFTVAPPSTATLLLVSEGISLLPQVSLNKDKIVEEVLFVAKDCRVLGDIVATLILGSKHLTETVSVEKKRFLGLFKHSTARLNLRNGCSQNSPLHNCTNCSSTLLKTFSWGIFSGLPLS